MRTVWANDRGNDNNKNNNKHRFGIPFLPRKLTSKEVKTYGSQIQNGKTMLASNDNHNMEDYGRSITHDCNESRLSSIASITRLNLVIIIYVNETRASTTGLRK